MMLQKGPKVCQNDYKELQGNGYVKRGDSYGLAGGWWGGGFRIRAYKIIIISL